MKIKCNDGIVREFTVCIQAKDWFSTISTSKCKNCGKEFGIHDTWILKPIWRKHICKEGRER